jgi:phenylacetic acid degradation operon negative regulatory protein
MSGGTGPALPALDLRPQAVLLPFFGDYVLHGAVASASVVDLLERIGVGPAATRATLNRMVKRGLLERRQAGRQAYFGLTGFGRQTVEDGASRANSTEVVGRRFDGTWTFVAFSLPDEAQRERHSLRSRLAWAGFGMVQAGLWASPRDVDVDSLLADLDVAGRISVFTGQPKPPADGAALVASAFDVEDVALGYRGFLDRWAAWVDVPASSASDPLAARIVLGADWLQVIRHDPRLPLAFLDPAWPALPAGELYRSLHARLARPAERAARDQLDVVE